MQRYANRGGDSGIEAFEIGSDWICVQFIKRNGYVYTEDKLGSEHIENMKKLALQGEGLGEYINKNREVYKGSSKTVNRQLFS